MKTVNYEIMYLMKPTIDVDVTFDKIKNFFIKSDIIKWDDWQVKPLAYKIKNFLEGYYLVITLKATFEEIKEMKRVLAFDQDFLRMMVINLDNEQGLKRETQKHIIDERKKLLNLKKPKLDDDQAVDMFENIFDVPLELKINAETEDV